MYNFKFSFGSFFILSPYKIITVFQASVNMNNVERFDSYKSENCRKKLRQKFDNEFEQNRSRKFEK